MGLFDAWFGTGATQNPLVGIAQNASPSAQTAGYQDPNKNIVNSLAALANAYASTPMQPTTPIQMGQAQMLNPVTFQHPQGQVDFARGPSPWGQGGY